MSLKKVRYLTDVNVVCKVQCAMLIGSCVILLNLSLCNCRFFLSASCTRDLSCYQRPRPFCHGASAHMAVQVCQQPLPWSRWNCEPVCFHSRLGQVGAHSFGALWSCHASSVAGDHLLHDLGTHDQFQISSRGTPARGIDALQIHHRSGGRHPVHRKASEGRPPSDQRGSCAWRWCSEVHPTFLLPGWWREAGDSQQDLVIPMGSNTPRCRSQNGANQSGLPLHQVRYHGRGGDHRGLQSWCAWIPFALHSASVSKEDQRQQV